MYSDKLNPCLITVALTMFHYFINNDDTFADEQTHELLTNSMCE